MAEEIDSTTPLEVMWVFSEFLKDVHQLLYLSYPSFLVVCLTHLKLHSGWRYSRALLHQWRADGAYMPCAQVRSEHPRRARGC